MERKIGCEVCGKPGDIVCQSALVPASRRYCKRCHDFRLEPLGDFDTLRRLIGDDFASWVSKAEERTKKALKEDKNG